MEYNLTQEQELLRQTVADFSSVEIAPLAPKMDWEGKVSPELLGKLPSLGLCGVTIPQEFGGVGADFLSLVLVVEELSKTCGSLGAQLSFHNAVIGEALKASPNSELRSKLLPKLATGTIGAFIFDQKSNISVKIDQSEVFIDGFADYVMSAAIAGIFLIVASLGDGEKAILCFSKDELADRSHFSVDKERKLLGMRASATARISFKKLKVPIESLLFEPKAGTGAFDQLLARSRLAVSAQALGLAQSSLDMALKYANERSQFNKKIGNFYAIRDMLAKDEIGIQTARALTYSVARGIATSKTLRRDSGLAKVSASNASVQAAKHSIKVHGGYGFVRDYQVERYLRDARLTQIYVESNEKIKSEIAELLLVS